MDKRNKIHKIISILLVIAALPFLTFAGTRSDRPSQVQLMATALGSGVSLGYNLGNHFLFGANYYGITAEEPTGVTENKETAKFEFSTTELMLRYYPFEDGGFYLQGSSIFRNWMITVSGYDSDFQGSTKATNYELKAEWPSSAISYGLGFNWIADFGLSGGLYIAAITGGEPELRGKVDDPTILQSYVDSAVDEMEQREKFGEKYSTIINIGATIGFNF